ncbi:hypothetical protein KDW_37850 [Dictyobacter vulcani]|uniref:Uncharacterized protein n=1 Tax=Dictyobacter vulcani TaxID=2607529 RepID=A0A5J4KPU8_9CHLR|nr:hypothetical protein KDW_37850 [Dictyobacter vulcani]
MQACISLDEIGRNGSRPTKLLALLHSRDGKKFIEQMVKDEKSVNMTAGCAFDEILEMELSKVTTLYRSAHSAMRVYVYVYVDVHVYVYVKMSLFYSIYVHDYAKKYVTMQESMRLLL